MTNLTTLESHGNLWEKEGMKRLYFNSAFLAELLDFSFSRYGTGNISGASLKGAKLSNTKARKLLTQLDTGKCWYAYHDDSFHTKYIDGAVSVELIEKLRQLT